MAFYLCEGDSDMQGRFNQSNISNYDRQYVEKLKLQYSSHYFIKFVCFMPIYYTINLDIVSSYLVFSYLYLESIDLLQV